MNMPTRHSPVPRPAVPAIAGMIEDGGEFPADQGFGQFEVPGLEQRTGTFFATLGLQQGGEGPRESFRQLDPGSETRPLQADRPMLGDAEPAEPIGLEQLTVGYARTKQYGGGELCEGLEELQ